MDKTDLNLKFGILLLCIALFGIMLIVVAAFAPLEIYVRIGFGLTGVFILIIVIRSSMRLDHIKLGKDKDEF